jgi:hypothetical protein
MRKALQKCPNPPGNPSGYPGKPTEFCNGCLQKTERRLPILLKHLQRVHNFLLLSKLLQQLCLEERGLLCRKLDQGAHYKHPPVPHLLPPAIEEHKSLRPSER